MCVVVLWVEVENAKNSGLKTDVNVYLYRREVRCVIQVKAGNWVRNTFCSNTEASLNVLREGESK